MHAEVSCPLSAKPPLIESVSEPFGERIRPAGSSGGEVGGEVGVLSGGVGLVGAASLVGPASDATGSAAIDPPQAAARERKTAASGTAASERRDMSATRFAKRTPALA